MGSGNCVCDDSHFTEQAASPCGTEKKSRVTAILLHVFVGTLGAGAFFVGWTTWGVLLLLMCCLPLCCICCGSAAVTGVVGAGALQDDGGASALCGGLGATCMVCVTTVMICVGQVFFGFSSSYGWPIHLRQTVTAFLLSESALRIRSDFFLH